MQPPTSPPPSPPLSRRHVAGRSNGNGDAEAQMQVVLADQARLISTQAALIAQYQLLFADIPYPQPVNGSADDGS
jgi:hypothetical protein